MVSVELTGGLGNQMFQIAACIAYAKKYGMDFHIPVTTSNCHSKEPYFTHLQNPDWDPSLPVIYYNEPNFHYDKIPELEIGFKTHNIVLRGYFQSYKYFFGYKDYILKAFKLIEWPCYPLTVSIHVRRGDYLLYPDKHPVVSKEYLSDAIDQYATLDSPLFKFFSDDIAWCKKFVNEQFAKKDSIQFEYSEGNTPMEDLAQMVACGHVIMSNSTFSWWAAYLCQNEKKKIVAPARWFGPGYADKDIKDLLPPDWIKL